MNITYMSAPNVISTKILTVSSCAGNIVCGQIVSEYHGYMEHGYRDTWIHRYRDTGGVSIISVHL